MNIAYLLFCSYGIGYFIPDHDISSLIPLFSILEITQQSTNKRTSRKLENLTYIATVI